MQDSVITKKTSLNFRGKLEDINGPKILGILNLTPDSFYDGGKNHHLELSINNVKKMLADGADIIDIGAYSSRPGATHISEQEEIDRLLPTLTAVLHQFPDTKISVDTFRAKVALAAVNAGAVLVNDISGGDLDAEMWHTVTSLNVPYIAMHMQGNPQNMQDKPNYTNVLDEVIYDLSLKVANMKKAGLKDIIIDPGFGFGKTLNQNYQLLKGLEEFELLGHPILIGVSRKSMIYNLLGSTPKESLNGTTAMHMLALERGASFLRVHDVKEAKEAITIWQKLNS
jgi:dihydropteroate synthase